jgi:lycopene cyclase domain-containing protein
VTLSYLGFHLLFAVPPIVLLFAVGGRRLSRASVAGVALLATIAVVYTTPWDNYLILRDRTTRRPGG